MKKKILFLLTTMLLGVSSVVFNSFAEEVSSQAKQERKKEDRPARPENEIFGKIISISENSVTISLAEIKKSESGQKDFEKEKNQGNGDGINKKFGNGKEARKELTEAEKAEMKKNLENMFTLTGETKTIDISKADFNAFNRGLRDGNTQNSNGSVNNNQEVVKTYKDYKVGDYISIELESGSSNTAKTVRDVFMMRGGMMPKDNKEEKSMTTK